ncbi:MAG: enoyl-CoA hydratase/isomerase family protein, partial [Calditrichaeota bacterium]|nr:enoyl-CoA hydratase/isomerase family protein [Calditrichota bacterium]
FVQSEKSIRGLILTGAGEKSFIAGADISELAELSAEEAKLFAENGQRILNKLMNLSKPVIAAINGFALGGGCELAMACHIRIASEKARFGQPEVNLGLIPGYGGTQRMSRLINKNLAMEFILTGDMITAERAYQIGLINRVSKVDELLADCKSLMKTILSKSDHAIDYSIDAINQGLNMSLTEAQRYEATLFGLIHSTDDEKEGCQAFIEKRKVNFKGK